MNITERILPEIIEEMRNHIQNASGNEVLFVGDVNTEGVVVDLKVRARGSVSSVPASTLEIQKGDLVIHNHPSGRLSPSPADVSIAAQLAEQGIGFYIVNNEVDDLYAVVEPYIIKPAVNLSIDELVGMMLPFGAFSKFISDYEPRDSQIEMLESVGKAFNNDDIAIIEAGTGVGKSFAYLLPALEWVRNNQERVVISTGTINLQNQLLEKDIPMLQRIIGSKISVALVKGRGNYVCKKRLLEAIEEDSLFRDEDDDLNKILEWSKNTENGSRSDLDEYVQDKIWSRVCSEAESCNIIKCSHREKCFVVRAKKKAAAAQILVANHHLLFSDLSARLSGIGFEQTAVLPAFQRIVFDEAHNIENSASSFFSETLNKYELTKVLRRLIRTRRTRKFGLLLLLEKICPDNEKIIKLEERIRELEEQIDKTTTHLLHVLGDTYNLRLSGGLESSVIKAVLDTIKELHFALLTTAELMEDIFADISDTDKERQEMFELRNIQRRLMSYASMCQKFSVFDEKTDSVFWIERLKTSQNDPYVRVTITPLDISRMMQEAVYNQFSTVVLTSATLSINNNFGFWKSRSGLAFYGERELVEHKLDSPFDYKSRVLLGIPDDSPAPSDEAFTDYLCRFIKKSIEISEGRALILFTSYKLLTEVYDAIADDIRELGISMFRQGDDDRSKLLNRFTGDTSSVLFATDSFWEGVDAPGDTLKLVIITKLPFKVPTDPVIQARAENIEARGGNPFIELSLPEAVMKLKQGFGRLMRKTSDHGVVLILDSRIIKKHYGSMFINSLPETGRLITSSGRVLYGLENFLYK